MAVPNTNTYSFSNVRTELQIQTSPVYSANTSLTEMFIEAPNISYDSAYKGSENRLSNFRNYNLITGWTGSSITARGYVASDGTNTWVTNPNQNSVTKITTGGTMTTYSGTGGAPYGIAFDGTNMWTANYNGNSVTKITPSGTMTSYSVGAGKNPRYIAFDGTNMWTANYTSGGGTGSVSKITPAGVVSGYTLGTNSNFPQAIAFDGTNMWVTYWSSTGNANGIAKVNSTGGTTKYGFNSNTYPNGLAYAASNMWVATDIARLIKVSSAGAQTCYNNVSGNGGSLMDVAFDGTALWVTNYDSGNGKSVIRVLTSGAVDRRFCFGASYPTYVYGVGYNNNYVWVTNANNSCIMRVGAI